MEENNIKSNLTLIKNTRQEQENKQETNEVNQEKEKLAEEKTKFIRLLKSTSRIGIDELISFLESKTDFFTAPASTRFHGSHEGGLLEHSLKVFEIYSKKIEGFYDKEKLGNFNEDSVKISSLLHDICKINYYTTSYKNVKNKVTGNWEQEPYFTVNDTIPFGHGEKSVMILSEFIKLLPEEKYAIRWHMGFTEPKEQYNTIGIAYEKYPLALLLHEADLEATYFYNI